MAEREGFEPPIALRLCLISSQVHSTGLCHLSVGCWSRLQDALGPGGLRSNMREAATLREPRPRGCWTASRVRARCNAHLKSTGVSAMMAMLRAPALCRRYRTWLRISRSQH